jgi:putative ABC transport system permease protein
MSGQKGWRRFFRLSESTRGREREVDDELHFHIEGLVEHHVAEGMSEEEARRVVMARFDHYATTRDALIRGREKEASTERRRLFFDGLRQDLRVSWRQYAKRPGFAAMAVVTLGLGIGASTTLFSVVNGVLLDPLPYPSSDRLVHVGPTFEGGTLNRSITAPEFLALKRETRILERYAAERQASVSVLLGDRPERLRVAGASEDYADIFGAVPILGRGFSEDDFRPGAPSVAILSHAAWQRYWGGDPEVLGTVISTTGPSKPDLPAASAPTIIGVMPASMDDRSDLWVPLRLAGSEWWSREGQFANYTLFSVGRLRSGSNLAHARAEMSGVATRLAAEYPQYYSGHFFEGRSLGADPLLDRVVGSYRSRILILFAGALLLLAIAVANLTGLYLARALERRRELAIRAALGGGRSRILGHLLTDTVSLSLLGCGLGFALSMGCLAVLRALAPAGLPRLDNLSPDLRVVVFAIAIALSSGLICALASLPSWKGGALEASLRDTDRTGPGRGTAHLRGLLVSAQVSLAVVLLVGAGLLAESLAKLRQVDPGFEAEGLLVMTIPFPTSSATPEARRAFALDLAQRIDAIPGVVSASWTQDPPMYWRDWSFFVRTEKTLGLKLEELPHMRIHPVGPDFFTTMGIPILRGRGITRADYALNTPVVVVDEVAAEQLWPCEDPLGKRMAVVDQWYTVVGIGGPVHQESLSEPVEPQVYLPLSRHTYHDPRTAVVIRSAVPLGQIAGALRAAVWEIDRTLPIPSISRAEDQVASDLRNPRFFAVLSSGFSLSALVLTLAAIFGLMSFWVTARTREVGLRMALGARAGQVLWAVQRQCLRVVLLGLGVGLILAAGAARLLSALLFGVSPLDPSTFALVAGGLGLAALVASLVPALRATRVDPANALRSE